ncbi:hypothetical protein SAMN06265222_11496 [Neorhodopirellula lusitana]|uniref:Photolyase/cryptochrome alpha/beta domain-containing protein n=1 Tax=Neorhodopirellula lusitana TaxID=445327 RepID=A0ABY1QK12_9BACT|nr:FAD-dependent oxidoreductase [Neorhodopirellula lusitana]SMP71675.1 hypothetical protein SAMN06265222_11496 [Neorhodopirellula lusitana]
MNKLNELLDSLDSSLAERVRVRHRNSVPEDGEFVLYWMRTAVRAHENPALSIAIELANRLQLPLLVYQGISERYPYASDRHHTFLLQGARDVQQELAERNIAYRLHLERPGHRGPHLRSLADRAAMVITEEMPVEPMPRWTALLCRGLRCSLLCVDTACIVPMRLVGKSYERAFAFRDATKKLYADRVDAVPLPEANVDHALPPNIVLPFEPIDLQNSRIDQWVSECDIDHSVGPINDTIGGSTAGYERWNAFKANVLSKYDRLRNDPLKEGASRMSAYLHYGMVSPMRIAREAAEDGSKGATKYLDELLIWRELAYSFCMFRPEHGRLSALPKWAMDTLNEHASDERPEVLSWETLARGDTGDSLWDSAQRSLMLHGELHNNVRMTWGKAILNWTSNPKEALKRLIDLNHRFALDGRDPASYGGILWCLGQFDRPFEPAQPIYGSVRTRPTDQHARRLDPIAYRRKVTRSTCGPMPTVAVIGAGLSGLACARTLSDHGFDVKVFEKSRGLGGRMATRRADDTLRFDHGAQYFTARDSNFKRYVRSWTQDGVVQPWQARIAVLESGKVQEFKQGTERFVAVPGMNAIGKHLATNLQIRLQTRVAPPQRINDKWQLCSEDEETLGSFDMIVVAAPADQATSLLSGARLLASRSANAEMSGCWCLMLSLAEDLDCEFDAAFVHQSPLSWISNNASKPGRNLGHQAWTIHATPQWSQEHLDAPAEQVEQLLLEEFWKAVGLSPEPHVHLKSHLWRYALPSTPLPERFLFDPKQQIGACGDWCGGPRVEGAFLSGIAMAGRLMGHTNSLAKPTSVHQESQFDLFDSHPGR